ncbi:fungal-specific transcription factor domain-containing protein [Xylogone sp. PMI_703]|nr:fungal-specific transcription factor domain-containing protein [Xylogone sp. PMI_703]
MDASRVRETKPALIYSLLCFAAQHHDFSSISITRSDAIDRLFKLTVSSVVLFQHLDMEPSLDDVISYIQLGSILSASDYQKKSVEWWSAAYLLAKQLRLNEECDYLDIDDQEKEERRRTWWLLYCVDRHQALSVRKSLAFRDAECQELLRPCDESAWNSETDELGTLPRIPGIVYQVSDCSFFGFILPLMSILGEIIELYNLEESECGINVEPKRNHIKEHLDIYDRSLSECAFDGSTFEKLKYYARHTLSTLHVLFTSKWDPLDVLTDVEACGLSHEVIYSAAMATVAASWIREIQLVDPKFDFLPLFFGLFLLQCSFPLLLVMKTFGMQSDENIIGGCEIIINAYEIRFRPDKSACDPSPYWSNFAAVTSDIKSMKSPTEMELALQTMQNIHSKVREIMGLFRWHRTGHGLHS